jgi:hypothetical protein
MSTYRCFHLLLPPLTAASTSTPLTEEWGLPDLASIGTGSSGAMVLPFSTYGYTDKATQQDTLLLFPDRKTHQKHRAKYDTHNDAAHTQ